MRTNTLAEKKEAVDANTSVHAAGDGMGVAQGGHCQNNFALGGTERWLASLHDQSESVLVLQRQPRDHQPCSDALPLFYPRRPPRLALKTFRPAEASPQYLRASLVSQSSLILQVKGHSIPVGGPLSGGYSIASQAI